MTIKPAKAMSKKSTAKPEKRIVQVLNVNAPGKVYPRDAAKYEAARKALLKVLPKAGPGVTQAEMMALTQEFFGTADPEHQTENVDVEVTPEAMAQQFANTVQTFYKYFDVLVEDRRANPRDDLATLISLAKTPEGEYVSESLNMDIEETTALRGSVILDRKSVV